jgi:hypothetical protein
MSSDTRQNDRSFLVITMAELVATLQQAKACRHIARACAYQMAVIVTVLVELAEPLLTVSEIT